MEIAIALGWFMVFGVLVHYIPFFRGAGQLKSPVLLLFFAAKVLAGTVLIMVYTWYYPDPSTADVYKYFNDGQILYSALAESPADYFRMLTGLDASAPHLNTWYDRMKFWDRPWDSPLYNDNRLVIRFNAFFMLFSLGSIWAHNVFINFLSFAGLVAMYRFVLRYSDPGKVGWIAPGLFLFPSLHFWGSGLLKEALLLWAFGFWMYHVDRIVKGMGQLWVQWPAALLYSFILILLKPYTMVFWVPLMIAFYFVKGRGVVRINLGFFLATALLLGAGLLFGRLHPTLDLLQLIVSKQKEFIDFSLVQDAGSLIHERYLSPEFWSLAKEFWVGLLHTLTRPHLLEVYSAVTLLAALENTLIMGMIVYLMIRPDVASAGKYPVAWMSFWFVILLMGFVGMVSPAHGGLVRYKIPALPFLWVFFVHMAKLPKDISYFYGFIPFSMKKKPKP